MTDPRFPPRQESDIDAAADSITEYFDLVDEIVEARVTETYVADSLRKLLASQGNPTLSPTSEPTALKPDPRVPRRLKWPPHSVLAGLSADTREDLLGLGTIQQFGSGETILGGGRDSRDVYLLLDGIVKVVSNTEDGATALQSIRTDGDLVGELASLSDSPRLATIVPIRSCVVRRIGQDPFLAFLRTHPDASLAVNRSVSAQLRNATWHRVEYGSSPVPIRLARLLIQLAIQHGELVPEGIAIQLSLTYLDLAALDAARGPAVHKALASLRHDEVIAQGYRRIVVRDWEALRSIAGITEIPPEDGVLRAWRPHSKKDWPPHSEGASA
jgi:CRP-like cAMP-binding protein